MPAQEHHIRLAEKMMIPLAEKANHDSTTSQTSDQKPRHCSHVIDQGQPPAGDTASCDCLPGH